jgi:hypothetical protein
MLTRRNRELGGPVGIGYKSTSDIHDAFSRGSGGVMDGGGGFTGNKGWRC